MKMIQKIKPLEKQLVYMNWADNSEFVKVKYVGYDFVEVDILDQETLEYDDCAIINTDVIFEIVTKSSKINRIIAEISAKLSCHEEVLS